MGKKTNFYLNSSLSGNIKKLFKSKVTNQSVKIYFKLLINKCLTTKRSRLFTKSTKVYFLNPVTVLILIGQ